MVAVAIEFAAAAGGETPQLLLPDDAKLNALFSQVDYNGNGGLSLAEIDKACVELWPHCKLQTSTDAGLQGFRSQHRRIYHATRIQEAVAVHHLLYRPVG